MTLTAATFDLKTGKKTEREITKQEADAIAARGKRNAEKEQAVKTLEDKHARLAYLDEAIPRWHTELEMDGETVKPQQLIDWHNERKALRAELHGDT